MTEKRHRIVRAERRYAFRWWLEQLTPTGWQVIGTAPNRIAAYRMLNRMTNRKAK